MFWTRNMPETGNTTSCRPQDAFGRLFGQPHKMMHRRIPACNIWADNDGAVLTSEIPGLGMEDVEITVTGREVTVKGIRKDDSSEGARAFRRERERGEFERSFQLPFQIESGKVEATLNNGVLQVILPRAENDKPRRISVSAG